MDSTPTISINSKLPRLSTTIFTVMSTLAKEHKAINLSQGFPGFPPSPQLLKRLKKAIEKGSHQYYPMAGSPELSKQITALFERRDQHHYHPESEITITAGATQAIFTAIQTFVKEGDEVILFSPAYDCYQPPLDLAGATAVHVELNEKTFAIPWEEVQRKMNRKTRMIIINSPHNPSGAVLSKEDLEQLERLVKGTDVMIISDEVYEHIVFEPHQHLSIASIPELAKRSLVVGSFGKTFHVTGWKIGYIAAPNYLMEEFRKVHQYNVFCVNGPMQEALAGYMKKVKPEETVGLFYQKKRDIFRSALADTPFELMPCHGSYFQLLGYGDISQKGDVATAKEWTIKGKIASIPISVFYQSQRDDKILRFCFAKEEDELLKGAEKLRKIAKA